MKKILSLDVGIHNLAYTISECKIPHKGTVINLKNDINICKFNLIDLFIDNRKKCSKILITGKNKGKPCNNIISGNTKFCQRHSNFKSIKVNSNICQFIITRGKNEGKICGNKIINNTTYCKIHDVPGCIAIIKNGKNKGNLCGKKILLGYKKCSIHCSKKIKNKNGKKTKKYINHHYLCRKLKLKFDEDNNIDNVDIILIEEQKPKNSTMVKISHYIYAYFSMRLPLKTKIIYLTARNRMDIICGQFKQLPFKGNKEYIDRKNNATLLCTYLFDNVWTDLKPTLFNSTSKKDDISDCIIQTLWYLIRTYNSCVSI